MASRSSKEWCSAEKVQWSDYEKCPVRSAGGESLKSRRTSGLVDANGNLQWSLLNKIYCIKWPKWFPILKVRHGTHQPEMQETSTTARKTRWKLGDMWI